MMLVNFAVMLGFIWQIQHNQEKQTVTVSAVLNDYAAMAAQQFARNIKGQIGYAAMFDLGQAWTGPGNPNSTIIDFLNTPNEQLNPSRTRVKEALTNVQILDHERQTLNAVVHPQLTQAVDTSIPATQTDDGPGIQALHDLDSQTLSFKSLIRINSKYSVITEYNDALVRGGFDFLYDNKAVLPTVLTDNKDNVGLTFFFKNAQGQVLWQSSHAVESANHHSITIDDDYGALFAGYLLTAHIDRALASQLIIGGLPQTQLPQLLILIGLAISAMIIMFWLYRRTNVLTRQKEQFIARASHELKTPLTQIRLFAETLELGREKDDAKQHHYLKVIHQESIRLSHLVDNILQQQQIQQNQINVLTEELHITPFLNDLLTQQNIVWQQKNIQVDVQTQDELYIATDPNLLKQVLINVLDNAVKFGPPQQIITIEIKKLTQFMILKITDQGPGIPKQQVKQMLQTYQRLERDEHRGINGNGLGLSIANNLCQQLGGQMSFEHPAVGLTVVITLPLYPENKSEDHA